MTNHYCQHSATKTFVKVVIYGAILFFMVMRQFSMAENLSVVREFEPNNEPQQAIGFSAPTKWIDCARNLFNGEVK